MCAAHSFWGRTHGFVVQLCAFEVRAKTFDFAVVETLDFFGGHLSPGVGCGASCNC